MAQAKDLLELVEMGSLECLNAHPSHSIDNALKQGYREDDGLFLESDTDEQLLVNIRFNQSVKLSALTIKGPDDGFAPKSVRLYTNQNSMGFSDVDSARVAQSVELTAAQVAGEAIPLKFVKFQNVTILSIFVESNMGDEDTTRICKIALTGQSGESMNVAEIKKQDEHA
jgi:hypothetical protein